MRVPYLIEERSGCEIMKLLFDLLGLNHRIKFIIQVVNGLTVPVVSSDINLWLDASVLVDNDSIQPTGSPDLPHQIGHVGVGGRRDWLDFIVVLNFLQL